MSVAPVRLFKRPDFYIALCAVVLGGVVYVYSQATFPKLPDGRPGPGLFPSMLGAGLAIFGLLLMFFVVSKRAKPVDQDELSAELSELLGVDDEPDPLTGPAEVVEESIGQKRAVINFVVIAATLLGFMLFAGVLGYIVTMSLVFFVIMMQLNARWLSALVTSVVVSVGLWFVFQKLLMVALPTGPWGW